jgi:glycosyltransferase involved in cell wall biosynthesis
VHERLWVWSPVLIPLRKFVVVRKVNRLLLQLAIAFWTRALGMSREILWTYNPMTTDLLEAGQFALLVYHCVDNIKAQPGMPSDDIERAECQLLRCADVCFVTAEALLASRHSLNANTHYFPNVADFRHFAAANDPGTDIAADIARLPAPRIGFIGAISGYKQDFALLRAVAQAHREWSIVLIGKIGEGDPWTDAKALSELPNVYLLGPRSYESLPNYLKAFDVAILPSLINDYTRGMFPMKFFEYLAAGRPVVSTDLPALQAYSRIAYLAKDHNDFIAGIESYLTDGRDGLEQRIAVAREQTYEKRTLAMMALIEKALAS